MILFDKGAPRKTPLFEKWCSQQSRPRTVQAGWFGREFRRLQGVAKLTLCFWQDFEPLLAAPDVGFWQELSQRKLDLWRRLLRSLRALKIYESQKVILEFF